MSNSDLFNLFSGLSFLQPYSKLGKFQRAAVSVDSEPCAKVTLYSPGAIGLKSNAC